MPEKNRLDWLNIVPMLPDYQAQLAADILDMYERKCITETAFILTLVPEGNPPVDKAHILGQRFLDYRAALGKTEMPVGILLQATMGHGWAPNSRSPFQTLVYPDGQEPYQFCPLDKEFQKYLEQTVEYLASLNPDFMMVDDDFRLLTGRGGCFCPLHLARFNEQEHASYTRETLLQAMANDQKLAARYDRLQCQSLQELAAIMRRAMDKSNPELPCSFCTCSCDTRHAVPVAETLAAPQQLRTVRINNARYLNESLRTIPEWLRMTAEQVAAFPKDYKLLAEPDTFPHNRYSTSVTMFNAQLTHSILSGCRGGKLWLSRTATYEPDSGRLFRNTLSDKANFYQTLAELDVSWTGVATVFNQTPNLNFPDWNVLEDRATWTTQVLGKMGIPIYFANQPQAVVALAHKDCQRLPTDLLESLLATCNCLLDGPAAISVQERGLGRFLGAKAEVWRDEAVTFERDDQGRVIPISAFLPTARLTPEPTTQILSTLYHRESGCSTDAKPLTPAVVLHHNPGGTAVAVVAAPVIDFDHKAFCMLNESRKAQLLDIFQRLGGLEWFIPGDGEVLLRAGRLNHTGKAQREDLLVITNLSLDPCDSIMLEGKNAQQVQKLERLDNDGSWTPLPFQPENDGCNLQCSLGPLQILVVKATV